MKRINLVKYGFVRWPEEDFSDDGNRFQAYRVGRVRVTKLVSDGNAYIGGDINDGKLPYEIYSKLPHFKVVGELNGVSLDTLTEDDIQKFYEDCQAYGIEYTNAENSVVYPTLEELQKKAAELYVAKMAEFKEVETLFRDNFSEAIIKFDSYEWKTCQDCFKNLLGGLNRLDPKTYPQTVLNQARSFEFMKREHKESFYATHIKELFSKHDIK